MNRILGLCSLTLLFGGCGSSPETASDPALAAAMADGEMSEHCEKHADPEVTDYARSEHEYPLPDVTLTDHTGTPVRAPEIAGSDRPVVLNFVFATCTTICPVMSATFARAREMLGEDADRLDFVSITIDPEHDTPAILAEYAEKYDATSNWRFLTGEGHDVEQVVRALDSFNGSKFSHKPITMLHRPGQAAWVRLEGLGSASDLVAEIRTSLLTEPMLQ